MSFPLLAFIVFFAFLIETAVGFGGTVVTLSLAAQLYPIPWLLAVLLPINFFLSSYIVLRYRKAVALPLLLKRILPFMAVGLAAGIGLSNGVNASALKPVFGLFVCGLAAVELMAARSREAVEARPLSPARGAAWLVAGGIVHGVFATGGPLIVYFVGRELSDKRVFRATLSTVWLVMNCALLVSYAQAGRLSATTGVSSIMLLLPLALGMLAGEWIHGRLDAKRFRVFVYVILLAAGLALLVTSLPALSVSAPRIS